MGRRLFPFSLTVDKAMGMVLAYEALLQYTQSPFSTQSLSAITKLRSAIPPDVIREVDLIHRHVVVVEPTRRYDAPFLSNVLQAALDAVHLQIVYDSRSGLSERLVYPHGLIAEQGFWYLACHDYRRDMMLYLRVDRIRSFQRVETSDRLPAISLRDWIQHRESNPVQILHLCPTVTRQEAKNFELTTLFGQRSLLP